MELLCCCECCRLLSSLLLSFYGILNMLRVMLEIARGKLIQLFPATSRPSLTSFDVMLICRLLSSFRSSRHRGFFSSLCARDINSKTEIILNSSGAVRSRLRLFSRLSHVQNHQINRNKLFNVSFTSARSKHEQIRADCNLWVFNGKAYTENIASSSRS